MYGDPSALRRHAHALDLRADDVRLTALRLRRRAATTHWVSTAAAQHRKGIDHSAQRLDHAASGLEHAAAELRRHADHLQHVLDLIAAAERLAVHWFNAAHSWLSGAVDVVMGGLGGLIDAGRRAPWEGWGWNPTNLPPSGHQDWLDVAQHVRSSSWNP